MGKMSTKIGMWSAGATLGGLCIGLAEAWYRDVPPMHPGWMYASLWAILGAFAGIGALALLFVAPHPKSRQWAYSHPGFGFGLATALGLSSMVLGRFILIRDLLNEAPGSSAIASLAAFVAGSAIAIAVLAATDFTRRHMILPAGATKIALSFPVLALCIFAGVVGLNTHSAVSPTQTQLEGKPPLRGRGVVMVVVDTLRADALSVYADKLGVYVDKQPGSKKDSATDHSPSISPNISPNIAAWAQKAAVFHDTSAHASWTRPAVASIMTSRHVRGHNTMQKTAVLPKTLPTIATWLGQHGIESGAVVTNYNLESGFGFAQGIKNFRYLEPARYLGAPPRANRLAAYNVFRLVREKFFPKLRKAEHFYKSAYEVNQEGMAILDRIGNNDFFLWLHYMEPHDPYFAASGNSYARVATPHPPASWANRMQSAYRDEIVRTDNAFADLLAKLKARGLTDTTTVILTADHGEEFAEHGGFFHGTSLFEEQIQVPLIIAGPSVVAAEHLEIARHVDIAPTIAGRFGLENAPGWEGRDLFGPTPPPHAAMAEEDHEGHKLASYRITTDSVSRKLIVANPNNPRKLPQSALYDLQKDPKESAPLPPTSENKAETERLRLALERSQHISQTNAATAENRNLDAEAKAALKSLGYVQ